MMLFSSLTYTETDEQLMERFVSKKSEKAFEELYRRYAPRLKGFHPYDVRRRCVGR